MGMIRKTISVGTLGAVSFRSKKERLRRAERAQREAEASLEGEHAARVAAEGRVAVVEKDSKRRSRRRKQAETLIALEPIVRSGVKRARAKRGEVTEQGRKAGRRARKAAKRSARKAKATVGSVKEVVAPHAERLVSRAGEAVEQLTKHDS